MNGNARHPRDQNNNGNLLNLVLIRCCFLTNSKPSSEEFTMKEGFDKVKILPLVV